LDVKIAFLYGDLEEAYMEQPLRYITKGRIWCANLGRQYIVLSKVHKSRLTSSVVSSLKWDSRSAI